MWSEEPKRSCACYTKPHTVWSPSLSPTTSVSCQLPPAATTWGISSPTAEPPPSGTHSSRMQHGSGTNSPPRPSRPHPQRHLRPASRVARCSSQHSMLLPRPRRGLRGIVFTRSVCVCVCVSVCVCVCVYLCVRPIFWYFISRLLEEISI